MDLVLVSIDRKLVSAHGHEVRSLACMHGTTVEKVKEIIQQTGACSRKQIEEALEQHFAGQNDGWK
jgi:hypothetical protein